MKRRFHITAIAVAIAATVGILACDDDDDTPMTPTTGSITGTVTFQGTWPSSGVVIVGLYASLPPMGPPDAFTDPIAPGASYDFQLDGIDPGTYDGVVVGWLDGFPPTAEETLGFYWAFEDSVAVDGSGNPRGLPLPVTVQAGKTAANIDMMADLDVAP